MATLASPFETDASRIRFSRHDFRRIEKSAQRFRGALTYDVKGNLVTRPASLQSPALSLVWDFDNKLRGADTNGTPATLEVTYEYDALGRRVARSGPGGNVVYFQAGQQTIADYPRGGVPASAMYRYVYGSYIDEPLLRETVSGSVRHFFHRNQQYSVTALTDSAGNTAERYAYTAYGGLTVFNSAGTPQATSPLNNRYTYTGREWDDSTKLYHFRARWFDPAAGRFVGRDPLGFVDGMGLYGGYFAPSHMDSWGYCTEEPCKSGDCRFRNPKWEFWATLDIHAFNHKEPLLSIEIAKFDEVNDFTKETIEKLLELLAKKIADDLGIRFPSIEDLYEWLKNKGGRIFNGPNMFSYNALVLDYFAITGNVKTSFEYQTCVDRLWAFNWFPNPRYKWSDFNEAKSEFQRVEAIASYSVYKKGMHVVELLNPEIAEDNAKQMLDWTKRLLRQLKKNGKDISFWPEASAGIAKFLHDQGCTSIVEVDEQGNEVRRAPQNGKRL